MFSRRKKRLLRKEIEERDLLESLEKLKQMEYQRYLSEDELVGLDAIKRRRPVGVN